MENKNNKILLIIFVVGAAALLGWAGWYENSVVTAPGATGASQAISSDAADSAAGGSEQASATVSTSTNITMNQLQIKDIVVGTGTEAKAGDMVTVQYVGTLDNGSKFDSSYDRNQPFSFQLGVGQVIQGWDEGVAGMKVGGKRELVIPSDLGYGANGHPPVIPPNSTLHFTVELLAVTSSAQ